MKIQMYISRQNDIISTLYHSQVSESTNLEISFNVDTEILAH